MATYTTNKRVLNQWNNGRGLDGTGPIEYTATRLRQKADHAGFIIYSKLWEELGFTQPRLKEGFFRPFCVFHVVVAGKSKKKGWGKYGR